MHQRVHNLTSRLRSLRDVLSRVASTLVIVFLTSHVQYAHAISAAKALAIPEVGALVALILATNAAMEDASRNPMDDDRRKRVQRAVSLLPAGIMAVAAVFRSGQKLHNADLPVVQGLLGGFVDVGAPDRFKAFFKNPDPSLIPKLGNVPSGIKPANIDAQAGALVPNPSATKASASVPALSSQPQPQSSEIVSLNGKWAPNQTGPVEGTSKFGYDDSLKKSYESGSSSAGSASSNSSAGPGSNSNGSAVASAGATSRFGYDEGAAKRSDSDSGFLSNVNSELNTIESRMTAVGVGNVRVIQAAPTELDREKSTFFDKVGKSSGDDDLVEEEVTDASGKRVRRTKQGGRLNQKKAQGSRAQNYKISVKPKYWVVNPLVKAAELLLIQNAGAQGCQSGQCGGKEGGGEGGGAADILMGIAMIISAIAPMIIASIQANADKAIARINADTAIKTTQIQSDTSKYLANTQKDVALKQAEIAQEISEKNNDSQSQRLQMQLAELRNAREDARTAEKEKREIEKSYNQERIALANKQAEDNKALAQKTLEANLVQAGLSSGTSPADSSGSGGLAVTRLNTVASAGGGGANTGSIAGGGGTRPPGGAGIPGGTGGGTGGGTLGAQLGATGGNRAGGGGLGGSTNALSGPPLGNTSAGRTGFGGSTVRGGNRNAVAQENLLSRAVTAEEELKDCDQEANLDKRRDCKLRVAANRRMVRNGVSRGARRTTASETVNDKNAVSALLTNSMPAGSSARGAIHRSPTQASPLKQLAMDVRAVQEQVPYWRGLEPETRLRGAVSPSAPTAPSAGGHSGSSVVRGAYRAPVAAGSVGID